MKKLFPLAATLVVALLTIPSIRAIAVDPSERAEVRYIDRGDIGTLDPNRMSWMQDIRVGNSLWEGLYAIDPVTFKPVLATADKAEQSADQLTWTFHLRDGAKWSNGDEVTSKDFVFAWKRMLEEPGDYTYLLDQYIEGAKEYEDAFADYIAKRTQGAEASAPDFGSVGIKSPDERTIVVKLKHVVTFFPDLCAFPCYFPLNERSMKQFEDKNPKTGQVTYQAVWATPPNLVTNGPYMLTRWQLRVGMRLDQNPHFWDLANVKNKSVDVVVAEDPLTQLRMFDNKEVDILTEVKGSLAASLRDGGRKEIHIDPSFGTYFYSFNCSKELPGGRKNPFADVRVRQALSMAIDKNPIVKNITKCGEPVTNTYVPPSVFEGYQPKPGLAFDVKAARKLMGEAGYGGGRNFPQVKLLYNTDGDHKETAEYIANQWQKNLNVKIELEGVEIKQFQQRLHNKDYDVARASWYGDYMDISTFTDKYLSWSLNNDANWMNTQYDDLCKKAAFEPDRAKSYALLAQAEDILNQEVPILPLYNYVNKTMYRDNVKGLNPNPRNMILLKNISVEK